MSAAVFAAVHLLRDLAERIESGEFEVTSINTEMGPENTDPYATTPAQSLKVVVHRFNKKPDC